MSAAVMAAVTLEEDTNVVVRVVPLQYTTAPLAKPEPFTVRVNAVPPTAVLLGASELIDGAPAATVPFPLEL